MKELTPKPVSPIPKWNLVNLSNSILRRFDVKPFHDTIPEVDALLLKHDKIAIFLFDGMGEWILNNHSKAGKPFLDNRFTLISSTNPATTVAATTAFLTGKYPIETGWLGWALPFEEYGEPVIAFTSCSYLDGRKLGEDIMKNACPVTYIDELIRGAGHKAEFLYQYGVGGRMNGPRTYGESVPMASDFFHNGGEFLYVYFNTPDGLLHEYGVKAKSVDDCIALASETVTKFAANNPDVLTLVIADHGLLDVKTIDLADYPEVMDCLRMPISLEGRTCNFLLKEGKEKEFLSLMAKEFPQFKVFSKEELLDSNYFGEGEIHPRSRSFLGDYIAISQDETMFADFKNIKTLGDSPMAAHHAGPLPEEKNIVLSAFNR